MGNLGEVREIESKEAYPFILKKHYAQRKPSISYTYGLFVNERLEGVVTFGFPASPPLCKGVCGPDHAKKVLELNRLCLNDGLPRNSASWLVSKALKMIPKPRIIVSFADTSNGHVGYIYQALNFIYTGLSAKHCEWKIVGNENSAHCRHVFDSYGGVKKAKEALGDKMVRGERARKHRYIMFLGCDKKTKSALRYKTQPYPKGDTARHNTDIKI